MTDFLRSTAAIVFVFGLVIFVHEFGHFLAAKLMGVYAPRFSIGFGPALWSRKWGETEYVLAAIPLGGYVRMASRDDDTMAFIEGGGEAPTAPTDRNRPRYWSPEGLAPFGPHPVPETRWFESKSFGARLLILIAGVTMNIILGFIVLTGMALALGEPVLRTRTVGVVTPLATAPQLAAGIQVGDTIVAVGPVRVTSWNAVYDAIDTLSSDTLVIRTNRAAVSVPAGAPRSAQRRALHDALIPLVAPVVEMVLPGSRGQLAGLHAGDSVIAVDGAPVRSWWEMVDRVRPAAGQEVTLEVARGAERLVLTVRPDSQSETDPVTKQSKVVGKIGAQVHLPEDREPVTLGAAVVTGAEETWVAAGLVVRSIRMLATGEASFKQIGGPVAIGGAAVQAARRGWEALLGLLALISINVAVFNLLPVPVLDGGQILLVVAERIKGGALSLRTREYLMRAGLALILLLLIVVMANDLPALWRSWRAP